MRAFVRGLAALLVSSAVSAVAQVSHNTVLLGTQDLYATYSDVWGYETSDGRQLAILGVSNGTSIVDVTTPAAPVEICFIPGPSSPWRDMKTFDRYGYIVTEGGGGLQIVDLEANPCSLVTTWAMTFDTAHNIAIADTVAYIIGAQQGGGFAGTRFLSLADPVNPVEIGSFTTFYIHDAVVRDDTLYAAAISNDFLGVVDVTDKANPVVVATWTWEGNNAHNCDLTTDGNYILTTDEVGGGDCHIFDIRDLNDVKQVATYTANPQAIIHNVYVRGDLAFISYYTEGLRVLDISNPEFPVEVGFYDTFPGVSGGFDGAWGAYPYTATGDILVSDIQTGLYVIRLDIQDGSVEGTVRESGAGPVLPGARVERVGGPQAQTNSKGFYKLYDAPGAALLVTSLFGFMPDSSITTLTQGVPTILDIELQRLPSTPLTGVVRDATTSQPLSSASVTLLNTPLGATSDTTGSYGFAFVPHGVYQVTASLFGYAPQVRTVTVTTLDPNLQLMADFDLVPADRAEDFEGGPGGWTVGSAADDATTGVWVWADPVGSGGGAVQPEDDHTPAPGILCWVTGNAASPTSSIGANDVDNGRTTLTTPVLDASSMTHPRVQYWRWFSNDAGSIPGPPDTLRVDVSNDGGVSWVGVERVTTSSTWTQAGFFVEDYVTPTALVRVRFIAEDVGTGSIVEAAIDDFMLFDGTPSDARTPGPQARLLANVPNPFNPSTRIRFALERPAVAKLRVFDLRGRLVRTLISGAVSAGLHETVWNGRDARGRAMASGVYFYRLEVGGSRWSRRMVLLK